MLHFTRMTMHNFGPYKGNQVIDFTDNSGVTIFWGNNGRGKTTLLNAFRYCLFGIIQRRNGFLHHLHEMENSEAANNGEYGFSVVLDMTNGEDVYKLERGYILRTGVITPHGEDDYNRYLSLTKNGSILSPNDCKHEINLIMPEQVSRFFLFDAELLQEYEELLEVNNLEGEYIKNAIEKILGVPVLIQGVRDIGEKLSKYESEKNKAARNDDKTNKYGQELENLVANIEQHQNIISAKNAELSEHIKKRNLLCERMKETKTLQKWISDKKYREDNIEKNKLELENVRVKIKELMKTAWKGMLLTTIRNLTEQIESKEKELNSKKQKKIIAKNFINEIKKAINERVCPICEQEVTEHIIARLNDKVQNYTSAFKGLTNEEQEYLYQLQNRLKIILDLPKDVRGEVNVLEERVANLQISITTDAQYIEELKEHIARYSPNENEEDIMTISREFSNIEKDIYDIRRGIEDEKQKVNELNASKERVSKIIDNLAGSNNYRHASECYELCKHLYDVFNESKTQYRERLKSNVEKDATELFVQLRGDPDYIGLEINDNYGLEIIHRSGRRVPGRSSGYEHVVALALIGALHKNAPLRGPLIIDSPFGRLDPTHKANIIRTLPIMAEQTILLAYSGEIDEQVARKELGSSLIHEYNLERVSSMHTEIR